MIKLRLLLTKTNYFSKVNLAFVAFIRLLQLFLRRLMIGRTISIAVMFNAVVFLDLKKAFDTVDHEILVSKLNAYGIRHGANDWFKSYLSDRTQKSLVNGFLSEDRFISCGVQQGTILGPLLFLLYINDLPNCLKHSHPRMFADDTHLTYSAANVHDIDQNLNSRS